MKNEWKGVNQHASGGAVYGLGLLGAIIYFLQNAQTVGQGIMGILKALVWPAFLVYKIFQFLRV